MAVYNNKVYGEYSFKLSIKLRTNLTRKKVNFGDAPTETGVLFLAEIPLFILHVRL